MLLPSSLTPYQQAQIALLTPQQQAQFFQQPQPNYQHQPRLVMNTSGQPVSRLMYIPTMGQSTIHLGPDGMIRMKQGEPVVNEEMSAEISSFVNSDGGQGEKEILGVN
jgi:hypothetical protein